MIAVKNLCKKYRGVTAVDNLSFDVEEGTLFAFLGTNGAGKTTTLSCITTLLAPDSGRISIQGLNVGQDDHAIRGRIGIVFQESLLDPELTVRENLALRATIYGGSKKRIDELVEAVGLENLSKRRYGVLSGGEKRRVDIARSLYHKPAVLILDEPTTGLDPAGRVQVWEVITQLRKALGLTVLLTTHYMHETDAADRVLVIDKGKELAAGTPVSLRAAYSAPRITVGVSDANRRHVITVLKKYAPRNAITDEGGAVHVTLDGSSTARAVIGELGDDLGEFQFTQGTMDDVFLNLTSQRRPA